MEANGKAGKPRNARAARAVGLGVGFVNGLFGSGGGTVLVPALEKWLGLGAHKAHATAIAVILPLSLLSLGIYAFRTEFLWKEAALLSLGGVVGGPVGARLLSRFSGVWLHRIFGAFMLAAAVRMIWF